MRIIFGIVHPREVPVYEYSFKVSAKHTIFCRQTLSNSLNQLGIFQKGFKQTSDLYSNPSTSTIPFLYSLHLSEHFIFPHSILPHSILSHSILPHSILPHSILPHSILPHSILPHSILLHSILPTTWITDVLPMFESFLVGGVLEGCLGKRVFDLDALFSHRTLVQLQTH